MKPVASALILTIAAALAACASRPPGTAAATATAVGTPQVKNIQLESRVRSSDVIAITRPQVLHLPFGYYHVVVNGQDRYCHKENYTGTRVQTAEVCLTKAQMEANAKSTQEYMHDVQSYGARCVYHTADATGGMGSCH
ncbi:MAG: hypothetical protein ACREUG_16490 [Steroidobacteraceae bacterium]